MTHLAYFPVYGHAFCPHCEAEFDLAQAAPTFGERFRKEVILYVMCPSCASHFNRRGPSAQKQMMNKCFCNVKPRQLNPDGSQIPWAVTTFFTLAINHGNLVSAIENGTGLTHELYQGLIDGILILAMWPDGTSPFSEVQAACERGAK